MALREVRKKGDEVLYKKCKEVKNFDERLHILLDDMYETMQAANGVGLAAPQVGILRRVVVIDTGDEHGRIELCGKGVMHDGQFCHQGTVHTTGICHHGFATFFDDII